MADSANLYDWERCSHEGIGEPGCVTCDPDRHRVADRLQSRSQKFFAALAAECRRPSFGDMQRDWTNALLNRAIEAKLYTPEPT